MHRWKDNIKMDLKNRMGWYGVEWIHLAEARQIVGAHEHGKDP